MQRRGVGLGALTRTSQSQQQYQTHGTHIHKTHIDELTTQLSVFQAALAQFARTHAKDIRSNPEFRTEFARMCTAIGVDPLASSSDRKGSFWAELLGGSVNDFYFDLAVRVVEVCRKTREENGGLIAVSEVTQRIMHQDQSVGGASDISEDDVVRAVKALGPLGPGFSIVEIGKKQCIKSVPKELNTDQSTVLEAMEVVGYVTNSMLRVNLGWDRARVQTVLDDLVSDALVWIDTQAEETEYWTTSYMGNLRIQEGNVKQNTDGVCGR